MFTNLFLPTDSLFLAILLVKQYIKFKWPGNSISAPEHVMDIIIMKIS